MNIVFMGTPDFAVPSLLSLSEKYNVLAVFTQPDRPKGRGKKLAFSDVKKAALAKDIPVYQPEKLKDDKECINMLKEMKPDFIVVVAFGQLLTKEVLDIPKYGCINLHGSILPMYRGAAPIQWAVINGEKESGNTPMLMNEGLDTGDILLQDKVKITEKMTAGELYDILKERGANLLIDTLEGYSKGQIKRIKQSGDTYYAKMLNKNIAKINWDDDASNINNLIRGLNPWPIAYTTYKNEKMKIFEANVIKVETDRKPGSIISVDKKGLCIACKNNILQITKVQFPNGKPLTIEQYINGHEFDNDIILG